MGWGRAMPQCSDCGARVMWARTDGNKSIALNVGVDPDGNFAGMQDVHGTLRVHAITADKPKEGYERTYLPHAATCAARQPAVKPDIKPATRRSEPQGDSLFDTDPCPVVPITVARNRRHGR